MKRSIVFLLGGLLASSAAGKESLPSVLHYKPSEDAASERPVATEISIAPQGSDYVVKVEFDKLPWGEECKSRCANLTLFLDTDNNRATGLQMGKDRPETGADLAITIQGAREYKERSADVFLHAKVRQISDAATSLEQGEVITELDHRRDPDRLKSDKTQVTLLVDATSLTIPSAKMMRFVYHPPADKALEGSARGMLTAGGGGGRVETIEAGKGKKSGKKRR